MNRFEIKIVVVLILTAALPLSIALGFASRLVDESVTVGLNDRVRGAVEARVPVMRDYIRARIEAFRASLAAIAESQALEAAIASGDRKKVEEQLQKVLADCRHCTGLRLELGAELPLGLRGHLDVRSGGKYPAESWVERSFPAADEPGRAVPRQPGARLWLTAVLERRYQEGLQEAGEFARLYTLLAEKNDAVKRAYLTAFAVILVASLLLALLIGVFLARRVTRHISVLIDATHRVAAGDLAFQIPVRTRDEIADLTTAFNGMLADLSESQRKIVYLETIAAWQEIAKRLAHEIKNPLMPILLAMQQVHKKYPGGDAAFQRTLDQALEVVSEEVQALRALVTEFSDFAKLPSVHRVPGELRAFAEEVARAESSDEQEVVLHAPAEPVPAEFDKMLLRRTLTNLVKNAREAMRDTPTPGLAPELVLRVEKGLAVLEVLDRGPGVSEEAKARVFDPYYTTKHDGTGLGLSIVKKIILDHEGTITVHDREGGGALFRITLPTTTSQSVRLSASAVRDALAENRSR